MKKYLLLSLLVIGSSIAAPAAPNASVKDVLGSLKEYLKEKFYQIDLMFDGLDPIAKMDASIFEIYQKSDEKCKTDWKTFTTKLKDLA